MYCASDTASCRCISQASQPTTTLQALVNLKRPSLRLSPISQDDSDESEQPQHHGLEFQFDCDAPKCGISLHIIPTPPKDPPTSSTSTQLIDVFHTAVDGGFGRVLKFEDGATLDLDQYDISTHHSLTPVSTRAPDASTFPETPTPAVNNSSTTQLPAENGQQHHKKRFTLRIRKRTHPHAVEDANRLSIAGPALQVVDAETLAQTGSGSAGADTDPSGPEKETKEKDEGGVRVLIKLEALDADGESLRA